jgi:hypothetical protein
MNLLTNYIGQTLTFNQPKITKREFELISSDEALAKMIFPKFFSNSAVIEVFDGKWEIKQPSIWRNEFGVYKYAYQNPFAKYVSNIWKTKGIIELPKGARLNCKSGQLKRPFEVYSSNGELLMVYVNKFSLKGRTTVTIEKRLELLDKYPWIIMLGWYIVLQNRRGRAHAAG